MRNNAMGQMMIRAAIFVVLMVATQTVQAEAFDFTFDWGDIARCTSGNPNTVLNPAFVLSSVPSGTAKISFQLKDTNVPDFKHGGGSVNYLGANTIPSGAFKYLSPCPPDGKHLYQWTAIAVDKGGKKLGIATASKLYP